MGEGYWVECSKCDYIGGTFMLGVGFLFPQKYSKTVAQIKKGKYGEEWRKFFADNSGAAVAVEDCLYYCASCHEFEVNVDLSLYNNVNGAPPEHGYWAHWCNNKDYVFVKSYVHKCRRCSKQMQKIIMPDKITEILCPKCGNPLKATEYMDWD